LVQNTKTGKIYQMSIKYTNNSNSRKIDQIVIQ
jgi:hypothetical protein